MHYELWHAPSASLMGTYSTEREALAIVRAELRAFGPAHVETLTLLCEDDHGDSTMVAEGARLMARAGMTDSEQAPLSA